LFPNDLELKGIPPNRNKIRIHGVKKFEAKARLLPFVPEYSVGEAGARISSLFT
jgi:hypothetical protein